MFGFVSSVSIDLPKNLSVFSTVSHIIIMFPPFDIKINFPNSLCVCVCLFMGQTKWLKVDIYEGRAAALCLVGRKVGGGSESPFSTPRGGGLTTWRRVGENPERQTASRFHGVCAFLELCSSKERLLIIFYHHWTVTKVDVFFFFNNKAYIKFVWRSWVSCVLGDQLVFSEVYFVRLKIGFYTFYTIVKVIEKKKNNLVFI